MSVESTGLVTVTMPAYNRELFLEEAVESVRSQTYHHWKLVIVDDGSTDKTLSIAKDLARKDKRIEIIELNHSGVSSARNTALSRVDADTEFVAFLDSDDVWVSDALQTLVESLRVNENCVGSHGMARIFDSNVRSESSKKVQNWPDVRRHIKGFFPRKVSVNCPTDFSMLVYGNFVPVGAALVRKWVFEKVGQFNPRNYIYDDWEMWIRISSLGPFAFINKELYKYRIHAANAPRPEKMIFAQEKMFFSSIYNDGILTDTQRTTLKRGYRVHQLYHGKDYLRYFAKKLMRGKLTSSVKEFRMAIERVSCALDPRPFD